MTTVLVRETASRKVGIPRSAASCFWGDLRSELGELLLGVGEAALRSFDVAEPAFAFGFQDPLLKVVADLDHPRPFRGVHDQDGAADTSMFMSTIGAIGAPAVAQGQFAALEVPEKLVPFLRRDCAVLLDRPQGPAAGDECPVGFDGVLGVDRGVPHRGPDVVVTSDDLRDGDDRPLRMASVMKILRKSCGWNFNGFPVLKRNR
ncbi:hypothetical protein [Streptomyces sp. NPDC050560]|uniref:hypothetical protein n=1 Tax=Streptomyces sp. NPDC050560 TaxID=3365630 RepID=UPI0037AFADD9